MGLGSGSFLPGEIALIFPAEKERVHFLRLYSYFQYQAILHKSVNQPNRTIFKIFEIRLEVWELHSRLRLVGYCFRLSTTLFFEDGIICVHNLYYPP